MSFGAWDPRDDATMYLRLVDFETPDGNFGFILGTDGKFTDVNGKVWWGASVIRLSRMQTALNGIAPSGAIGLSYFQDSSQPDLIDDIRAQGLDYLSGRAVRFYLQPILSQAEFAAPTIAPVLRYTRTITSILTRADGGIGRSISVQFEAGTIDRRAARGIVLNTEGHASITGSANPSLTYMPTTALREESLFG